MAHRSARAQLYQKTIEFLSKETFESQVEKGGAWVGTPDDIRKSIASYDG